MGEHEHADDLRTVIAELRDVMRGMREDLASAREDAAAMRELVAQQTARIAELEARLGRNSTNSSKPPSSDGPWSKKRRRRRPPSSKKQGAQPGHKGKARKLVDEADETIDHEPQECSHCGHDELLALGDEPRRHQVTEIPPLVATVTEHRLHHAMCTKCGGLVTASLPREVPNSAFGPRLQALTATLVGGYRLSRSETARLLGEGFGVSISTGSVSNIEGRVAAALAGAHEQALAALNSSALAHVDETPWKLRGKLHWLWTGVAEGVTVHRIDLRRNREAFHRLVGVDFEGLLVTDRLATYDSVPNERRQLCWAHLERDFRAFVQGPHEGRAFGERGLSIAQALMRGAREYKQHGDRTRFEDELRPHLGELVELLVDGACADIDHVSGFAAHLLARADALWTFADHEGVPATNNAAERAVRKGVLWRRGCFGSQSERGLRFAERMLTVVATKRKRGEALLEYLVEVVRASISGADPPPLLRRLALANA